MKCICLWDKSFSPNQMTSFVCDLAKDPSYTSWICSDRLAMVEIITIEEAKNSDLPWVYCLGYIQRRNIFCLIPPQQTYVTNRRKAIRDYYKERKLPGSTGTLPENSSTDKLFIGRITGWKRGRTHD